MQRFDEQITETLRAKSEWPGSAMHSGEEFPAIWINQDPNGGGSGFGLEWLQRPPSSWLS